MKKILIFLVIVGILIAAWFLLPNYIPAFEQRQDDLMGNETTVEMTDDNNTEDNTTNSTDNTVSTNDDTTATGEAKLTTDDEELIEDIINDIITEAEQQ